jgi:hypothetical protein
MAMSSSRSNHSKHTTSEEIIEEADEEEELRRTGGKDVFMKINKEFVIEKTQETNKPEN